MKTMQHENQLYWQVTDHSAVRCHQENRLEILTWNNGEVIHKSRTVKPSLYRIVKSTLEGIA